VMTSPLNNHTRTFKSHIRARHISRDGRLFSSADAGGVSGVQADGKEGVGRFSLSRNSLQLTLSIALFTGYVSVIVV
jgi:hypothetical protein